MKEVPSTQPILCEVWIRRVSVTTDFPIIGKISVSFSKPWENPVKLPRQGDIVFKAEDMHTFSTYTTELTEFADTVLAAPSVEREKIDISKSLFDSQQVETHLRTLIPIESLRDAGTFFTGDILAERAVAALGENISRHARIIDPACGAGNLLIASSKKLPVVKSSLRSTLRIWGKCLFGFDLFDVFIEATKLRLILEAVSRGAKPDISSPEEGKSLFSGIKEGDAFDQPEAFTHVSHIILNPPFYRTGAFDECQWAQGKVNASANFLELCAENATRGTHISAVLPEVLRSGSRYEKWRDLIQGQCDGTVCSAGRFDSRTDVDVFLLSGKISKTRRKIDWLGLKTAKKTVGDYFDVSIGPVVPYRDKRDGDSSPYIHPKNLPLWEDVQVQDIDESWDYAGTLKKPPFVAVRRTSSPSDTYRAAGTLVKGKLGVAVENHLIAVRPKSGRVGDCRKLLQVLRNKNTNNFLNQRIRCRHLTVSSVKDIPWIGDSV